jgi:hypothetical protein
MSDNLIKQRADAHFSKLPGVEHGKNAASEYKAGAAALADKTARLKALRLARDAAKLAVPPSVNAKKIRTRKTRPAVSLSDWLKNRQRVGRIGAA